MTNVIPLRKNDEPPMTASPITFHIIETFRVLCLLYEYSSDEVGLQIKPALDALQALVAYDESLAGTMDLVFSEMLERRETNATDYEPNLGFFAVMACQWEAFNKRNAEPPPHPFPPEWKHDWIDSSLPEWKTV